MGSTTERILQVYDSLDGATGKELRDYLQGRLERVKIDDCLDLEEYIEDTARSKVSRIGILRRLDEIEAGINSPMGPLTNSQGRPLHVYRGCAHPLGY